MKSTPFTFARNAATRSSGVNSKCHSKVFEYVRTDVASFFSLATFFSSTYIADCPLLIRIRLLLPSSGVLVNENSTDGTAKMKTINECNPVRYLVDLTDRGRFSDDRSRAAWLFSRVAVPIYVFFNISLHSPRGLILTQSIVQDEQRMGAVGTPQKNNGFRKSSEKNTMNKSRLKISRWITCVDRSLIRPQQAKLWVTKKITTGGSQITEIRRPITWPPEIRLTFCWHSSSVNRDPRLIHFTFFQRISETIVLAVVPQFSCFFVLDNGLWQD